VNYIPQLLDLKKVLADSEALLNDYVTAKQNNTYLDIQFFSKACSTREKLKVYQRIISCDVIELTNNDERRGRMRELVRLALEQGKI